MLKALMDLGLSRTDAEVYLFLAAKAPQKATDIANALKMKNQQLYPSLRNLQIKGIINCTSEHPQLFSAVPIEDALSAFISADLEEARYMEKNREQILSLWRSITEKKNSAR
jgi:sugar-specific transcriptional regulator TrmB